jgi:hypothetical protein
MPPLITPKTDHYLRHVAIPMRLSCISTSGWPVVLSLWYLYSKGRLYCATQKTARVIQNLQRDSRCAFEIAADQPPYCGVRGQGIATIDPHSGVKVLERLLVRYLGGTDNPLANRLLAASQDEVAIIVEPVKVFTWDYSDRMRGSVAGPEAKLCPD